MKILKISNSWRMKEICSLTTKGMRPRDQSFNLCHTHRPWVETSRNFIEIFLTKCQSKSLHVYHISKRKKNSKKKKVRR